MKQAIIISLFLFNVLGSLNATEQYVDSLVKALVTTDADSTKIHIIEGIIEYYLERNPKESIEYIKQLENIAKNIKDNNSYIKSKNLWSVFYARTTDLKKSNEYLYEAKALVNTKTPPQIVANIYLTLGINFLRLGDYDKSIAYLDSSVAICIEHNISNLLASNYVTLGLINVDKANYDAAEKYYFKALEIYKIANNPSKLQMLYTNLTSLYSKTNKIESALKYVDLNIELLKSTNNIPSLAFAYHNKASLITTKGMYDEALYLLNESIRIKKEYNNVLGIGVSYNAIAEIYLIKQNYRETLRYIDFAINIFKEKGQTKELIKAYSVKQESLFNLGNFKEAYKYLTESTAIKDSLFTESNQRRIDELNAKYNLVNKENEYERLKSESEKQKFNLIIISLILIMVLTLSLLLFVRNRAMKKINNLLEENKNKIEKQNSKLESLNLELNAVNEELMNTNLSLAALNSTKDKFFSIISHDLKSPVSSQNQLISMLNEHYNEFSDEEKSEYIHLILDSSNNTYELLENLLVWGKVQMNKSELHTASMNLSRVILNTTDNLASAAALKKIAFQHNYPENIEIIADVGMIATVIRNIVNNSIKFTPNGGQIFLSYQRYNNSHCIIIQDTGIGMSQQVIDDLFKIDKSISRPGTNQEKGTGLGLIICKEFIDMHKGEIQVESVIGKGTTFTICIPDNFTQSLT